MGDGASGPSGRAPVRRGERGAHGRPASRAGTEGLSGRRLAGGVLRGHCRGSPRADTLRSRYRSLFGISNSRERPRTTARRERAEMGRLVPAVTRALDILELFLEGDGTMSAPEITRRLGLPR